jgi:hypothetical protein
VLDIFLGEGRINNRFETEHLKNGEEYGGYF